MFLKRIRFVTRRFKIFNLQKCFEAFFSIATLMSPTKNKTKLSKASIFSSERQVKVLR